MQPHTSSPRGLTHSFSHFMDFHTLPDPARPNLLTLNFNFSDKLKEKDIEDII